MINITVERKEINFTVQQPKPVIITIGGKPISFTVANRNVVYSTGDVIEKQAAVNISGHKVVVADDAGKLIYADNTQINHANKILGISKNAASIDGWVSIQTFGELEEQTWDWLPGKPIYLGANGAITQSIPATGFILMLAFAVTNKKIFIDIKQPIIL